ncbi:MAG: hypothetical protein ACTHKL_29140 [Streptosporangiaceae bacterium]
MSRTSAWAVGTSGGPIPLIERWDGVSWTAMASRPQPGLTYPALYAVVAVDPRYGWAILDGNRGSVIEKWNGTSWKQSYQARTPETPR